MDNHKLGFSRLLIPIAKAKRDSRVELCGRFWHRNRAPMDMEIRLKVLGTICDHAYKVGLT
jgi:hypothetical protein